MDLIVKGIWIVMNYYTVTLWITAQNSKSRQNLKLYVFLVFQNALKAMIWAPAWENQCFAYTKTKKQISFAVTAKLISAFVFATWIENTRPPTSTS